MKKIFVVMMSFILIFSMIGCSSNSVSNSGDDTSTKKLDNDKDILHLIKHLEDIDKHYYNITMSYEEYINELNSMNKHLSSNILPLYEDNLVKFLFSRSPNGNLTPPNGSLEDYKEIHNGASKALEEGMSLPWEFEKTEISDVYHDPDTNSKYVFTKFIWRFTSEDLDHKSSNLTLRKYHFIKEDGEWKILAVDRQTLPVGFLESKLPHAGSFNGEPVEYKYEIKH